MIKPGEDQAQCPSYAEQDARRASTDRVRRTGEEKAPDEPSKTCEDQQKGRLSRRDFQQQHEQGRRHSPIPLPAVCEPRLVSTVTATLHG